MQSPDTKPPFSGALRDRQGLVWSYALGDAEPLDDLHEACACAGPVWLHFNLTDARARSYLSERAGLSAAVLAVLLDPRPRVRITLLEDGVAGVVEDLYHDFNGDAEDFGELRFYVGECRIITIRRHPLRAVDLLRRRLESRASVPTVADWLVQFVEALAASFGAAVTELVAQVDALEDDIVDGKSQASRATLANLRRLLVRFRRHVNADRHALVTLRGRELAEPGAPSALRLALEHLDGVAQDLDLVHERVRLLQEEVAGILAEATNRNLYVLSVVTTVLLPTTVITGLWGMNVSGLPFEHGDHGFAWVTLTVLGSVVFSLVLLRGTRVL
jgi:zinc transporter